MAEEKPNGEKEEAKEERKENLYDVVQSLIFEPSKIKATLVPLFPEASRNYSRHLLLCFRQGSPLRRLLFISVGTVALVALSGLVVFMLFFLAATINAIFVSLLISLAVAGGFLALFFAFVTAIYIGALSVAIFAISTVVFWAVVAIVITAGWVGFLYTLWLGTRKSLGFAKRSLSVTGSAITTHSAAWGTRNFAHKKSI
ncbi:hypothetical protein PHAVU_008G238800 [Phaseolus vulgaris]|uniref:Uncharacterized protein n=1 Tax=Phaseolus vulgaris TaxID=3885 RepID=V7BAP1_PHAVU|nr:hypothetical protein PHAVU_008G238800g [Phaseolus vulgaris]ESW13933.1 hypothetical protein PHAVU_008G238800g [Phaseolus vulgaris]